MFGSGCTLFIVESGDDQAILNAALLVLADGPLSLSELTTRLFDSGALVTFDGLLRDELMLEIDEILLDTDDTWMSQDQMVALTSTLIDGAVFSHRLTPSELERGVIDATPDLGVIDFDAVEGLELVGGGTLQIQYPFHGEPELDENGSYVVPPGAMSQWDTSEVVCLRRQGTKISLDLAAELGRGEAEERALRAAFENQHVEGFGVEPDQLVMDALCHDPSLFRAPGPSGRGTP